ncbi:dTMP kinase [Nocardia aobensis]|uniref:dTMP kinase n=1 Tax=Nocardia aobensis TaxID=257277 RepID=UPI0002F3902C|nr:dTMP kinase [Nocardia aobensis]
MVTGKLITIDGAGGVGKSTTVASTVKYLRSIGLPAYATSQPSRTVLGAHIRGHTDTYTGIALACLVAGDRHHQQRDEIVPALDDEKLVVCDRYLPSSLVLQVLDGVPAERVWQLNAGIRVPDVAVVLRADPKVIADRLAARGAHNRFERRPDDSVARELELFDQVAEDLRTRGWPVHGIDCTEHGKNETALAIAHLVGPAAGPSR